MIEARTYSLFKVRHFFEAIIVFEAGSNAIIFTVRNCLYEEKNYVRSEKIVGTK